MLQKKNKKREAALKNEAGRDEKHLFFLHGLSYGACEKKTRSDLCFELKQIQSVVWSHNLKAKSFAADTKYD